MKGEHIHILEELGLPGGSMDGIYNKEKESYIIRGGREMEPHFECLWDLFRSIPSTEHEGEYILDEFYRLNRRDPSYAKTRVIVNRGQALPTDGQLLLTPKAVKEIVDLCLTPEKDLQNKKINEVFTKEFFESNFWLYWSTMFAFEPFFIGTFDLISWTGYQILISESVTTAELSDVSGKIGLISSIQKTVGPGISAVVVNLLNYLGGFILDFLSFLYLAITVKKLHIEQPTPNSKRKT